MDALLGFLVTVGLLVFFFSLPALLLIHPKGCRCRYSRVAGRLTSPRCPQHGGSR